MGRGGRRPGAGRNPNALKRLVIRAADLIRLSPEELQALEVITRKLAPAPQNQKESNRAIKAVGMESESTRWLKQAGSPVLGLHTSELPARDGGHVRRKN